LLLRTTDPRKFVVLGDRLYEEEGEFDIFKNFKEMVLNKKMS
jgi:hypothetical protein